MGVRCSVCGANYGSFQLHEEDQKLFSHFTYMVLLRLEHVSNLLLGEVDFILLDYNRQEPYVKIPHSTWHTVSFDCYCRGR